MFRHLRTTAGSIAVIAAAAVGAGCATAAPVAPLPAAAPITFSPAPRAVSTTPAPTTRTPTRRPPTTTTRSPSPTGTPLCQGRTQLVVTGETELAFYGAQCVAVGSVLRIEDAGPDDVVHQTPDLVRVTYAAGIHMVRLIGVGTVRVTVRRGGQSFEIVVVV